MAEQKRIVARVEQLRSLCANLRERLIARKSFQAFAEALVDRAASTARAEENTDDLAAAA
jgi:type I restriction enzyme, S subunit